MSTTAPAGCPRPEKCQVRIVHHPGPSIRRLSSAGRRLGRVTTIGFSTDHDRQGGPPHRPDRRRRSRALLPLRREGQAHRGDGDGHPRGGPVRQGLGAQPGAGEVPGLPRVQGDLGGRSRTTAGAGAPRSDLARTRLARASSVGDRPVPPRLAVGRHGRLLRPLASGLPRRRDARSRQDDLRAHPRRGAARPAHRRPRHDRRPDRAPQAPVGRGGRAGRHPDRPDVRRRQGQDVEGLRRHRRHLRWRGRQPAGDADPHRQLQDAGDPRRGAPRR